MATLKQKKITPQDLVRVSGDPEFFVAKVSKTGVNRKKIIPICGLLGGTKEEPIPIPGCNPGYMMQEDGVAVEFNFPPAHSPDHFQSYVACAFSNLERHLASIGLSAVTKTSHHEFTEKELATPAAMRIGCSPDADAYARKPREGISVELMGRERFTAGHFHISFPNPHSIPNYVYVRMLDAFLGLPFVPRDKQGSRRKFYGLAGLYRDTKYPDGSTGLEYRTMSNFWVTDALAAQRMAQTIMYLFASINKNIDMAAKFFDMIP